MGLYREQARSETSQSTLKRQISEISMSAGKSASVGGARPSKSRMPPAPRQFNTSGSVASVSASTSRNNIDDAMYKIAETYTAQSNQASASGTDIASAKMVELEKIKAESRLQELKAEIIKSCIENKIMDQIPNLLDLLEKKIF
ncbi:hypothetical protein BGZ76_000463 [Entomortierella beljakovae]|nr:hypothetical protein BGZ76_000463 [Entomortierella beljakovae]